MEAKVISLTIPDHGDDRGNLIALEGMSDIVPFEIKRVYYSFDTQPGSVRGNHAHKNLKQLVICLSGACTFVCEMPDGTRSEYVLDWPNKGLLVEGMVWREIKNFSKDCVMVVLASEHYNEADYIRDYREFLKEVGVNRIAAHHDPRNPHSGDVMKKCGLQYEGTLRQAGKNTQGICDIVMYAVLKEDHKQ